MTEMSDKGEQASSTKIVASWPCVEGGPWSWEYTHMMPREMLASKTHKTASNVALFGGPLTVSPSQRYVE
jgi:hypothetical protein